MSEEKNKGGRPTLYNSDIAAEICEHISEGNSLRSYCEKDDTPSKASVFKWLIENKEFSDQYARARSEQADVHADEIIDIADETHLDPQDRRVKIDARKWVASKLKPKKYSERVQTELTGKDGGAIKVEDAFAGLTQEQKVRKMEFILRREQEKLKASEGDDQADDA